MENYQRLRDLREDKDLKQWQIAEIIHMKQEQYQRYESGKRETPLHIMMLLADYYNVSLDYITGRTNDKGGLHCNFLDSEQKKLLQGFGALKQDDKNFILQMIDKLSDKPQTNAGRKSVG